MLAFCLIPVSAKAQVVLDWDVLDWTQTWTGTTGETLSQTFNNVDGSGIDVTISITAGPTTTTGAGGEALNPGGTAPNPDLPDDLNATPLSNGGTEQALMVDVNYGDLTQDFLRFTIAFSEPVTNVDFDLWDIDRGDLTFFFITSEYSDVITNIQADNAAPTDLTLSAPGLDVNVSGVELIGVSSNGDATALGNENDANNNGEANVDFGTQLVSSVSFDYRSNFPTDNNDPTLQRIALHDINFVVPEPGSALLVLTGMLVFTSRRRRGVS